MKHRPGEPCAVTSRMHGSAGGGWKRAVRQRAGRLPFTSRKVTDEFILSVFALQSGCSLEYLLPFRLLEEETRA